MITFLLKTYSYEDAAEMLEAGAGAGFDCAERFVQAVGYFFLGQAAEVGEGESLALWQGQVTDRTAQDLATFLLPCGVIGRG